MASMYTDAEREERYARLRSKKIKLDRGLDFCMWGTLLVLGGRLAISTASTFFFGMFLGASVVWGWLLSLALTVAIVLAIYKRSKVFSIGTLIACPVSALLGAGFLIALLGLLFMIPVLIIDIQWEKLSQEEGFPLFDISYEEQQQRSAAMQKITEKRALAAGVRTESTSANSDMEDIINADAREVVPAHLQGYHDRTARALPGTQANAAYQSGVMDEIPAIPPQAPQSAAAEMEEL